jgi:hypothetical protein
MSNVILFFMLILSSQEFFAKLCSILQQVRDRFTRKRGASISSSKSLVSISRSDLVRKSPEFEQKMKAEFDKVLTETRSSYDSRILELEKQNDVLKKQLEEYKEVVVKLKETITSLDKINRNIVEDLHMELQFRADTHTSRRSSVDSLTAAQVSAPSSGVASAPAPMTGESPSVGAPDDKNCRLM